MAQTQPHQFASQTFSPPVSSPSPGTTGSPVNGGGIPPPPKRQRLSPLPQNQSPYASPSFGTMQLPPQPSPMMNGTTVNGLAMPNAASSPPPPPPPGAMGPPSRPPAEKATDAAELTDVLASSGIDVREEEAFLTSSYATPGVQARQAPRPQPSPLNTSFVSQTSSGGTISATASFTDPPLVKPPTTQETVYTESANQPVAPFKDPNESTREDTEAARRAQYHLQQPFLFTKVLEQRLQRRGFELGVRIPSDGLFNPVPGRSQPIEVTGPDGSSVVRAGHTILNQDGAPLVDILNLLSISSEERLRTVIDYSSTLARSRRAHSHGLVPLDWQDLAVSTSTLGADGATANMTPVKRRHSDVDGAGANRTFVEKYRILMAKDVSGEEERNAKRAKRSANAILGEGPSSGLLTADIPASGAATPIAEKAPSLDRKGMSKKEAKRLLDAKISEAQQHQQSVETARMATNSMLSTSRFGAKKSYSWLKGNGVGTTGSGFATPTRAAAAPATPTAGVDKVVGGKAESTVVTGKRLGTWREDKEGGRGIQVRDILFTLELDGRGSRHIQKAYSKDVREDRLE